MSINDVTLKLTDRDRVIVGGLMSETPALSRPTELAVATRPLALNSDPVSLARVRASRDHDENLQTHALPLTMLLQPVHRCGFGR